MSENRKFEVMLDNHHVHLRQETVEKLFGVGYVLPQKRYLGGGEYVSTETIDIQGPKGTLKGIRVLGPHRPFDQVELLASDAMKLGVDAPVVESGNLKNACDLTLIGPGGQVTLPWRNRHRPACAHLHQDIGRTGPEGIADSLRDLRRSPFRNVPQCDRAGEHGERCLCDPHGF